MMFYDPVTGQPHDHFNYVVGAFIKSRPTTEQDACEHGWVPDERPDAHEIREALLAQFHESQSRNNSVENWRVLNNPALWNT